MNTGLDPELLVLDSGYIVPASYYLDEATTDDNGILNDMSYDNAAAEIRPEHSEDLDILTDNTEDLLYKVRVRMRLARRRNQIPSGSELSLIPAAKLHPSSRHIKSVCSFGCSPSSTVLNDYSVHTTQLRADAEKTASRSAGFHIHQELSHYDTVQPAVAVLDGLLGLKDVTMNCRYGWKVASDIRREELGYGRAGEHRVRMAPDMKFILEYRVMSPWPLSDAVNITWATRTMKRVCETDLETLLNVLDDYPERARITSAINTTNVAYSTHLRKMCLTAWTNRGKSHA